MSVQVQAIPISTTINGQTQQATVDPGLRLVDFLRDELGLTGTKEGCETGQCGACTVLLDDTSVKSCAMLAAQIDGSQVTTIEGLTPAGSLTPLQEALSAMHALQCGYCTPAMTLALTELLTNNGQPSEAEIRVSLDGIMCRCGVYQHAISAVQSLAGQGGK
jgi:aerobic carbon-monoxide dehydrogenase small subunit